MVVILSWFMTGLALVGVVLNIKKDSRCFAIWVCTNFFWCVYDFHLGAIAQSALFAVYFCLAIWGLWEWKKSAGTPENPEPTPLRKRVERVFTWVLDRWFFLGFGLLLAGILALFFWVTALTVNQARIEARMDSMHIQQMTTAARAAQALDEQAWIRELKR